MRFLSTQSLFMIVIINYYKQKHNSEKEIL